MSNTTIRNLIVALIVIIAAIAAVGLVVYLVVVGGEQLEEQVEMLQKHEAQEASQLQLQRTADTSKEDRAVLQEYFLKQESNSIDFLNHIEGMAPVVGVDLKTNELQSVQDTKTETDWIEVSFSILGSRNAVQRFIQVLETLPYLSRVTSVTLSALSSQEWQAEVTVRVRVLALEKDSE